MQNTIEQIDNNEALKEDVKDPNQALLEEIDANKEADQKLNEGESKSAEATPDKAEKKEVDQTPEDIKKDMIDPTNPKKTNGAYTEQKAFHTGKHGNTFTYEDVSKRAGDYEGAVDDKKENTGEALATVERANQKEREVEDKEKEVNDKMESVGGGEVSQEEPSMPDNPIPEGEQEHEQMASIDTKHTEDVAALRKEEDAIDDETVEKLNTFAA